VGIGPQACLVSKNPSLLRQQIPFNSGKKSTIPLFFAIPHRFTIPHPRAIPLPKFLATPCATVTLSTPSEAYLKAAHDALLRAQICAEMASGRELNGPSYQWCHGAPRLFKMMLIVACVRETIVQRSAVQDLSCLCLSSVSTFNLVHCTAAPAVRGAVQVMRLCSSVLVVRFQSNMDRTE